MRYLCDVNREHWFERRRRKLVVSDEVKRLRDQLMLQVNSDRGVGGAPQGNRTAGEFWEQTFKPSFAARGCARPPFAVTRRRGICTGEWRSETCNGPAEKPAEWRAEGQNVDRPFSSVITAPWYTPATIPTACLPFLDFELS